MAKEISTASLHKKVETMSLQNCVLWSNKIEEHIESLKEILRLRQGTVSFNKFYDNDHKIGNLITDKMNSLQAVLNKIYERIHVIAEEELQYDFEMNKFSEILNEVQEAYMVAKVKAEKTAKDQFKERLEVVKNKK